MARPSKDSGARLACRQMGAILKKNALLKMADWRQTLAEVTIPALFMLLLVWIKSLTTVYDSPATNYTCGQTIPWQYEESLDPATMLQSPLFKCLQKPPGCTAENYYRDEGGYFEEMGLIGLFPTVGYMDSGDGFPWYGFTVGDNSEAFDDFRHMTGVKANNPSQDLDTLASRLRNSGPRTVIAVAPAFEQRQGGMDVFSDDKIPSSRGDVASLNSGEGGGGEAKRGSADGGGMGAGAEMLAAEEFSSWLIDELGGDEGELADVVQLFSSEQALIDYVRSADYDRGSDFPSPNEAERSNAADSSIGVTGYGGMSGGQLSQEVGLRKHPHKVGMAIIFNKAPLEGEVPKWDYTLRLNYTYGVSQLQDQVTTSALERPPTSDHMWGYSYSGFLSLQKSVDEFILSKAAGERMYLNVSMGLFPEQAYLTDQFQEIIASTLGIFYMLAFLYPVSRAVRVLVSEKEGRMKEALKMMGLPDLIYHGSWLVTFQVQWVVTNVLIMLVVRTSVFRYSNHWLVFLWLEAVALSVMAFCFLMSTFFSRSKTAATLGSLVFFAAFFPYYYVGDKALSGVKTKTWASLLAPTCLALGSDTFAAFEGGLVGVQLSNMTQSYEDHLPYVSMVAMLLADSAIYFLLAWYLDKVIPSEFGTPLPWHFPVSGPLAARRRRRAKQAPSPQETRGTVDAGITGAGRGLADRLRLGKRRWGGIVRGSGRSTGDNDLRASLLSGSSPQPRVARERVPSSGLNGVMAYDHTDEEGGPKVEPVGPQLSRQVAEGRTVSTRGLVKVYGNGKKAVKGLDLDLYEGQISVLLGHNGAGKSTAISMITGTLPPTRGEAYLRGRKLTSDLVGIRRSLGVCFQQNTLFDQLTVFQHLQLFAVVKGVRARDVDDEAARMVSEVGLMEKKDTPASALSGGQKRKLSVALAFIGGSEVIVLDEPTSGMDPFSRRSTWSVLQRQRKGRVILLTTHFMDEADTLGDRIAIMAEGELRCMGSSLFLKGLYGVGYTLTVIKADEGDGGGGGGGDAWEGQSPPPGRLMVAAKDGKDALEALVLRFVPEALTVSKVGKERNYRLPFASSSNFVDMFREIDFRKEQLGVAGYGVSVTTLEEVFLRVGHGAEMSLPSSDSGLGNTAISSPTRPSVELSPDPCPGTPSSTSSVSGSSYNSSYPRPGGREGASGARTSGRQERGESGAGGAVGAGWREQEDREGHRHAADTEPLLADRDDLTEAEDWPSSDVDTSRKREFGSAAAEDRDRASRGMFWVHFKALVAKRTTYGMRDKKSQFFQLIVPTLLFLLGLLLLRSSRSMFDQPSLLLSPATNFNPGKPSRVRNPVPMDAPEDPESLARQVADRFDGISVEGTSVLLPPGEGPSLEDQFGGCAQGASPLVYMSDFLLQGAGADEQGASRYGAIVLDNSSCLPTMTPRQRLGLEEDRYLHGLFQNHSTNHSDGSLAYGVLINASAVHAAPIFVNLVNSAALQAVVADGGDTEGREGVAVGGERSNAGEEKTAAAAAAAATADTALPSITIRSSPLPRTRGEELARQTIDGFTTAIMVVISICFLPASYAIFVVKERAVKAKHQQIISGVGIAAYWSSTFVFDVVTYLIPCSVFLGLLYAFDIESYTTNESASATALLFLLYGPAVAPFTYCISFFFKSASSAQNMVLFINFVTGLALMVTSFVLNLVESTRDINASLKWIYRLFPGFCLGDGLAQLVLCKNGKTCVDVLSLGRDRVPKELTPFSAIITGADIACLMASCVEDDEDVAAEARRVEEMEGVLRDGEGGGEVILNNLRKVYRTKQGPKVAVQGLSFSVARGDCFGFLGINGAGKSTTLGILSGDICPTRGKASIAGHDILTEQNQLRRYIGYCPQDDALLDLLTVEEHLLLYARIKGVNENRIGHVAGEKMQQMDLTSFRETKAFELSGGNKRKLSVAIAMIGDPRVVFLDEPSTGMDPIARRFMWDIISRMTTTDRECSVILTTHSMEEAESLCNNIGIMVNGRLRCLGSTQHLKHRFGSGFEADMKLQPPSTSAATEVMQLLMAHGVANIIGDDIDSSRLWGPLDICCDGLARGDFDRAEALETALKSGSGAFLQDVLGSEGGTLPTRLFIDWYLCEQRADDLNVFLAETFPGAELVERPTLFSCRYKIPYQDGMKLADVFEHFEAAKAKLGLASYAVGQTTLEQIFNSFAVTKDNPEVRLRQTNESEDVV
ncbi:conserved unknown protein [Ectocarpus siliculosus]|uniref:ABC transporter domain-containing protein n=1 Tax=Ectocarpus siliculosus TaxID=2880 RepID=D7FL55_ECTSI|nr:conserved unknown protein [Ectocarpus siliculosus]|eukprot:CBJ29591.1 conserved unknown protein [Ectocarpus siliculosus]